MMLLVGITTAPRCDEAGTRYNYLDATLRDFRESIGDIPHKLVIAAEPGSACPDGVEAYVNDRVLGVFSNWVECLRRLVGQAEDDQQLILMLQDDVMFTPGAVDTGIEWLQQHSPDIYVSLYTSPAVVDTTRLSGESGFVPAAIERRAFWGALAGLFTTGLARKLLASASFRGHLQRERLDVVIGHAMQRDIRQPLMVHVPSLCDHRGEFSSIGRHKIVKNASMRRGFQFKRGINHE
jgi:hypothetical protein